MNADVNTEHSLSKKIKQYRRIKNFSQERLAEVSGISIRTIQRIERGESIGSAYTLDRIAAALEIDISQVTGEPMETGFAESRYSGKLNALNLSALSVILIPFLNIILPLFILSKNKGNADLHEGGRKIVNFQIIWTLGTIIFIVLVPLFLLLFKPFRGGSMPLFIPVYYVCIAVNIYFTLKFSIAINNNQPFLNRVPHIW